MKGKGMRQRGEGETVGPDKVRLPGVGRTILAVLICPPLLTRGIRCIWIILTRFFLFQYRSALFPRLPVSRVEHPLDELIPFNPCFIRIYLDFIAFWIRIIGFLSIGHGKRGRTLAADFIVSITKIYTFAFQVYRKNLSTTDRPAQCLGWYKKNIRFLLVHLVDPHLMCIPSLHVMLVVHSYTAFRHYLRCLGEEKILKNLAEKVFKGALNITEAVLYVKQHSVNCIAAALYAMNRFDPALFTNDDAETFIQGLFRTGEAEDISCEYLPFYAEPRFTNIKLVLPNDAAGLRKHIVDLYRIFCEKENADWTVPLLEFLHTARGK